MNSIRYFISALAFFILTVIGAKLILGGASTINLSPAPGLTNAVSQSLNTPGSNGSIPIEGQDYKLSGVQYFDNKTYAVVKVTLLTTKTDPGTVVLQKLNGTYRVILGPGTNFPNASIQNLPSDLASYLQSQGLVYEPTD